MVRTTRPAAPGASVPALHAQGLRPTSTDWQDRPPPRRRRDRAADHQDAGKPLCARVQRRGATPARAQVPPAGVQRRALTLTPESPQPSLATPCKEEAQHAEGLVQAERSRPCGTRTPPLLEEAQGGAESRPRNRQGRHRRLPPGAKRLAEPPCGGSGGERNQWHGQSAAAPVPSFLSPLGGGEGRQGAASVWARCRADGGPERRLAAQRPAGAVQRRRCISRCTDRSAGGCADRRTLSTTRARAFGGQDAAEAAPRRRVRWRSRGRRWNGP